MARVKGCLGWDEGRSARGLAGVKGSKGEGQAGRGRYESEGAYRV